MATLSWRRDIGDTIADAKNTFSSWDGCMSKTYCKWPVIIAIIVGSLIALSLLWCLFRCLCCGVECCCGCLSCCNACCPSPRRKGNQGYQQAPPTPNSYYQQYQPPHHGPMYASSGKGFSSLNTPQTATFDAPSKNGQHFNEDALPAMPSWDNATSRRVETHDDVEMEKLNHERVNSPNPAVESYAARKNLLPKQETGRYYDPEHHEIPHAGDESGLSAHPYHKHLQYRQVSTPSPSLAQKPCATNPYLATYEGPTVPPPYINSNDTYFGGGGHSNSYTREPRSGYELPIPSSHHTGAPSFTSPANPQQAQPLYPGQTQYRAYSSVRR